VERHLIRPNRGRLAGLALAGAGALAAALTLTGTVPALAWAGPPELTAVCSYVPSAFYWHVDSSQPERNYNVDYSLAGPAGPWTEVPSTVRSFTFATLRNAGDRMSMRWHSDPHAGVTGPVAGDGALCSTPTPTPTAAPTPTPSPSSTATPTPAPTTSPAPTPSAAAAPPVPVTGGGR